LRILISNTEEVKGMERDAKGDLLFEIGTEELPAGYIPLALKRYEDILERALKGGRLGFDEMKTYGTPRRLVFVVRGLPLGQSDHAFTVKGPRVEAAYDDKGEPTKTLLGFARAQGVDVESIVRVQTKKGEAVAVQKTVKGEKTASLLPAILEKTMAVEVFPKRMKWGAGTVNFARPVRRLLAIFNNSALDVKFGHVKSAPQTLGHRFIEATAPVKVAGLDSYFKAMEDRSVVVDQEKRKAIISRGIEEEAHAAGGRVLPDRALMEEVAWLVEYPVVIRGAFDEAFLALPREIIINAMRSHQRYFSILDSEGGLLPYFITVANTPAPSMDKIINGNERVLRARLNDARFYFEKDRATPLAGLVEGLKAVIFQARLGSSYEKVLRFTRLALYLGERAGLIPAVKEDENPEGFLSQEKNPASFTPDDMGRGEYMRLVIGRSAMLCKADLLSGVVGEFPDLQGIMGGIYARLGGEAEAVALAMEEHYRPTASGGVLPSSEAGLIISMADKLDTIAGFFAIGKVPTGTVDPYALRRQAIGIINMLLESGLTLPLDEAVERALTILGPGICKDNSTVKAAILEFFSERLRQQLLAEGLAFDSIDAVLATEWYNISDAAARVRALDGFKANPACEALALSFKRVSNILKGFHGKGMGPDKALFGEEAETRLMEAAEGLAPRITQLWKSGDYNGLFEALASIKEEIDGFFDDVMVMVDDAKVKKNRLLLLDYIRGLYVKIADISRLAV